MIGDRCFWAHLESCLKTALVVASVTLSGAAALADDVQYAQPGPSPLGAASQPALSDIMNAIQSRHAKLWYAGNLGNWPLAKFELAQLQDEFLNAAMLYRNIPVDAVKLATNPLNDMDKAVASKNGPGFVAAYKTFTNACNACHAVGDVGFIAIRVPTAQPYSNQIFEPATKPARNAK